VESAHDALGLAWLDGLILDLRHALRALARSRSFAFVGILVLAITVAINTLIFFMLDGVVLRPLPYASPERLVRLYDSTPRTPKFPMSIGHYLDYRATARSLDGIALYTAQDMELGGTSGGSKHLSGVAITGEFFQVLGRTPLLGRTFSDDDLRRGVRHVVISARVWRDDFQADPGIVGRPIRLNRETWTVIGVAPDGFQHVGGDYRSPLQGETVDVWAPLELDREEDALRYYHFTNAVARIREGFTPAQSRAELEQLAEAYRGRYPKAGSWGVRMEPLLSEVTGRSRDVIWLLVAAGVLVLLAACANIAGLSVARAVARRRELALRRALGASRWRVLRVGLAENLMIGVAGAVAGLALAGVGLPLLRHLLPADFPRAHEIGLTLRGAIFAAATSLATVIAAGLLATRRHDGVLAQQRVTAGRDSKRLRTALVVGEVALAGLLCAGTLFLLRSYQRVDARDHGFIPSGALTFRLTVPRGDRMKDGDIGRLYETIRANIAALPGVTAVGATTNLPWSGYDENSGFSIVGRTLPDGNEGNTRYQAATAGYFQATGMRLTQGRLFDARDTPDQPPVVVVNDALASRYFPKGDAVGATVDVFGKKRQIVGVVRSIKDTPTDLDAKPGTWFPLPQVEFATVFFAVRTAAADAATLTPAVRAAVAAADPELPVSDVRTLEARAASALAARRFALWLFQAFAATALVLAAAGIYGLLAYIVRQRRKELGIRVALGASRGELWTMVVSDGLKMGAGGALSSLALIPLGGWLLQAFLFNVTSLDPITLAVTPAALLAVAAAASLGPAFTATRSDPAVALRED
jgi:predicted permease